MSIYKIKCVFIFYLLLPVLLVSHTNCNKLVSVPAPVTLLTADVVFASDASANAAMTGLYVSMEQTNLYFATGALTINPGMSSDELQYNSTGSYLEFYKNAISTSNSIVTSNLWRAAYNYIYQANAIMEGIAKSAGVSPSLKKQLRGEALFIRAFSHFYLVNLFGDVPLITSTALSENTSMPRTPASQIYSQIENDLSEADTLLSASLVRGRPCKWASMALHARVQLYQKNYNAAVLTASSIITQSDFSLESDLSQVFLAQSKEAIFQFVPISSTINTFEGNVLIPGTSQVPNYSISSSLMNAFEPGDARKAAWINSTSVNAKTYYYPFKYKVKTGSTLTEYYSVIRLAELYLIRAEAYAQLNNIASAKADLDIIRNRAGLAGATAVNSTDLLVAIQKERQTELFAEWGHRWLDLKRTGQADNVLNIAKAPNWKSTAVLYPIPATQITLNIQLQQNPGY